jgi:hypothetical protein
MTSSSITSHNLWTIAKFVISINDLDKNAKDVAFENKIMSRYGTYDKGPK